MLRQVRNLQAKQEEGEIGVETGMNGPHRGSTLSAGAKMGERGEGRSWHRNGGERGDGVHPACWCRKGDERGEGGWTVPSLAGAEIGRGSSWRQNRDKPGYLPGILRNFTKSCVRQKWLRPSAVTLVDVLHKTQIDHHRLIVLAVLDAALARVNRSRCYSFSRQLTESCSNDQTALLYSRQVYEHLFHRHGA